MRRWSKPWPTPKPACTSMKAWTSSATWAARISKSSSSRTARTSGESLLTIINDILDFSKIEAGKFTLDSSEFDLDRCLQEITRMMAVPAHEKGLELLYENRALLPECVLGDPGRQIGRAHG